MAKHRTGRRAHPRGPVGTPAVEGPLAGEVHPVVIESLSDDGDGVARVEGVEFRVGGTAPGDEVSVRVDSRSTQAPRAWARVVEVHARGPAYLPPPCRRGEHAGGHCGGCGVQHLVAAEQLALKARAVARHLRPVWADPIEVVAAPAPWEYRNRSNLAAFRDGGRNVRLGSFAPRSREGARMDHCRVVRPELEHARAAIEALLRSGDVPVHVHGERGVRWVSLRSGVDGQVLVELITSGDRPTIEALAVDVASLTGIAGVWISHNTLPGNAVRDEPPIHIAGRAEVHEQVGPLTLPLGPSTFFQLNTAVAARMYARAAEWLGDAGRVVDLYCGVGGIGLTWAHAVPSRRVEGAEFSEESVAVARRVAQALGRPAVFNAVDLSELVPAAVAGADAVVVNPPRRGLDRSVLGALVGTQARHVVYMSCAPDSFARDLALLGRSGWRLTSLEVHDMLPQTAHVELLGRLERR